MSYRGVGPGIDISHYGAPYKQMLGLGCMGGGCGDMLYRYQGMGAWTGTPSEDPRMVKRFTVVRATWNVRGLPSGGAPEAAQRIHHQGRQKFPGNTVRKIGSVGWISGGRVGYEVVLADSMRAGEIKLKNFQAGKAAERGMGGSVRFTNGRTIIPANGFTESAPDAPATPEDAPSAPPGAEAGLIAGLPLWGWGAIGAGALGLVAVVALGGGKKRRSPAPTPNRRRRRSSRRRRR